MMEDFDNEPREVLLGVISALYEGAEEFDQVYQQCRKILAELVELKDLKDTHGKTEEYVERQAAAWKAARNFLYPKLTS